MISRRRYTQPISNNTQSPHNCAELKNEVPVLVRSLKRKKSSSSVIVPGPSGSKGAQRAENRAPATSKTIPVAPSVSKKDKGKTEETSNPPRDTRRHNVDEVDRQHGNIPVGRHFFTGPLAVAEHERLKKEIETLRETLHESRQICSRQAKVITL